MLIIASGHLSQPLEERRHLPGGPPDLAAEPLWHHSGQIIRETAASDVHQPLQVTAQACSSPRSSLTLDHALQLAEGVLNHFVNLP